MHNLPHEVFDTLQYTKRAIKAGYSREQAEEMASLIHDTLVTKNDLHKEFQSLEIKIQQKLNRTAWLIITGVSSVLSLFQLISHLVI